jgi:hypothetical protein
MTRITRIYTDYLLMYPKGHSEFRLGGRRNLKVNENLRFLAPVKRGLEMTSSKHALLIRGNSSNPCHPCSIKIIAVPLRETLF